MCLLHLDLIYKIRSYIFHYLIESLEIALILMKCTFFTWRFFKFQKCFLLEFQKSPNGFSHFQNPPGRTFDVQWYSWLLPALGLHAARAGVQLSARGEQARHTWQVWLKWNCFHQIVINQQTPLKKYSLETSQGEAPISDITSKASRPHSIISNKLSLLKHRKHKVVKRYKIQSLKNALQSESMWL